MCDLSRCPTFEVNNEYYTQKDMWKNISHLIPKDKVIWESCMLNSPSKSMEYWKELGYKVVGDTKSDMLNCKIPEYDICITNPPFETKLKTAILKKLVELDKPFIIVMNATNLVTNYMRTIFGDKMKYLQTIIPHGKICFEEYNKEKKIMINCKRQPAFYCSYVCYKMNIPNENLWLKN